MLPFTLSFLDDVVPDNYRLPVTASVSGGDAAAPAIYRPPKAALLSFGEHDGGQRK